MLCYQTCGGGVLFGYNVGKARGVGSFHLILV